MEQTIVIDNDEEFPLPSSAHRHLYKYFPSFGATKYAEENITKLILEQKIRTTCSSEVNDPFDWNPSYEDNLSIRKYRDYFRYMRDLQPENQLQYDLRNLVRQKFPDENSILKIRRVPKVWSKRIRETIMGAFDSFGFVCYAEKSDEPLMWAHYGSAHSGLCIEFPTASSLRHGKLTDLPLCAFAIDMEYQTNRPQLIADENIPKTNPDALRKAMLTKSSEWEYEKEWRVSGMYKLQSLLPPKEWISIGREQPISAIIFGLKSSDQFREKVKCLVSKSNLKIAFKECYLSDRKYKLRIRNL
jgi:hypothetical protein